eukprot:6882383-Alexandrium_andersonii.AAC.1
MADSRRRRRPRAHERRRGRPHAVPRRDPGHGAVPSPLPGPGALPAGSRACATSSWPLVLDKPPHSSDPASTAGSGTIRRLGRLALEPRGPFHGGAGCAPPSTSEPD